MPRSLSIRLSLRGWLPGLILVITCAACMPVPIPIGAFSKTPFPPKVLQRLAQKEADKNLVQEQLGNPCTVRDGGKYWFYSSWREVLGFIGTDLVFDDFEWLAVGFDVSDHVTFIEHNDSISGCLSNGICNYSGLLHTEPRLAVLSAPKADDQFAKSYQVSADECAIYIYMEPFPINWAGAPGMKLSIDGNKQGVINNKTYLFLTHSKGDIHIEAYQIGFTTHCRGEEKLYVKVTPSWKSYDMAKDLSPVDPLTGEAAIRSRQLALPY